MIKLLTVLVLFMTGCSNSLPRSFYKCYVSNKMDNEVSIRYKNKKQTVLEFYPLDVTPFAYLKQTSKYKLQQSVVMNYGLANTIFYRIEHGKWFYYDIDGKLLKIEKYKNGVLKGVR